MGKCELGDFYMHAVFWST